MFQPKPNRSLLLGTAISVLVSALTGQEVQKEEVACAKAAIAKLPLYFIENQGVYSDDVAYYIKGADKTLFFTAKGVTFALRSKDRGWVVKLQFVGANPDVEPSGEDRQQAIFSHLIQVL